MEFLVRVNTFERHTQAESYKDLKIKIRKIFKYVVPKNFRICYQDQELDLVSLGNDDDFMTMIDQNLIQPISIQVEASEDIPSEEDSSDELKKSLTNSFKMLREITESVQKRKGSSIGSNNPLVPNKVINETEIAEEDNECDQSQHIQQKIDYYKRNITQLQRELKAKKPAPLTQNESFQKFIENLERGEQALWECTEPLQFKNEQINFLSLADEFMIILKQRAKEIDVQWKKEQTKQKFIKKYNEKIKKKKQVQSQILTQSEVQRVDNTELKQFYEKEVSDKAQMLSNILNLPLSASLYNFVQAYKQQGVDELVLEALENKSVLLK